MKRFLLLSDIHATNEDPNSAKAASYVSSKNAAASGGRAPLADLRRQLADEGIAPDYVLCAGDMTNRSDPSSLSYVWSELNSLASSLNAKLITTVGNHDIDSRYQSNKFDPRGYAMALDPLIPFPGRSNYLEYWAEHFTIIEDEDVRVLVLNTAAFHGGGAEAKDELEHGRVSGYTLDLIKRSISELPETKFNVLLCHHHPLRPEPSDSELEQQMRGGPELIELLAQTGDPWVIVHGHKHRPELYYGHGGGNAPVIMGCASFSAQVNFDSQNKNPNQVHLLTLDPDAANSHGYASAGQVLSWNWQPGVGWARAKGELGLPYRSGFGYRNPPRALAKQLEKAIPKPQGVLDWGQAMEQFPGLAYQIPSDQIALRQLLEQSGISLAFDSDGLPLQVGRWK